MKKSIKVHKRNEVTRGSDIYSLNTKKAMNAIYYGIQKHRELGTYKHDQITIQFSTLRKLMDLDNDGSYVTIMKDALTELMQPIHLHNYFHPIDEIEYSWYATTFLIDAGFYKRDNGDWVTQIRVSPLIKHLMQLPNNQGQGFTELELIPYLNKFRTKYSMKIYEYLKSFGAYSYLDITQNHMMKLLALDEKSKYNYYSQLFVLVERQTKDIAKKSDLKQVKLMKSKTLSKDKIFRIQINPKSKKEADKTEAKTALENLIKRF